MNDSLCSVRVVPWTTNLAWFSVIPDRKHRVGCGFSAVKSHWSISVILKDLGPNAHPTIAYCKVVPWSYTSSIIQLTQLTARNITCGFFTKDMGSKGPPALPAPYAVPPVPPPSILILWWRSDVRCRWCHRVISQFLRWSGPLYTSLWTFDTHRLYFYYQFILKNTICSLNSGIFRKYFKDFLQKS